MTLEKAKEILGSDLRDNGSVYCSAPWVSWVNGVDDVTLDGDFTLEYLQALATWMEHVQEKQ